jgi:hypothetical protein
MLIRGALTWLRIGDRARGRVNRIRSSAKAARETSRRREWKKRLLPPTCAIVARETLSRENVRMRGEPDESFHAKERCEGRIDGTLRRSHRRNAAKVASTERQASRFDGTARSSPRQNAFFRPRTSPHERSGAEPTSPDPYPRSRFNFPIADSVPPTTIRSSRVNRWCG